MHWAAMRLPILSHGKVTKKGFRHNEKGYWLRDITEVLRPSMRLQWFKTENWSTDNLSIRGKLGNEITSKKILVIGAGAVGSAISELLVRAGINQLTIIDNDSLVAGNLVRHSLLMDDVGQNKASALAYRLNHASPHASITAIERSFPPVAEQLREQETIRAHNLIVDCTGDDQVLHNMNMFEWDGPKQFVSVSLGVGAKRLFIFTVTANKFPYGDFRSQINPWLSDETEEFKDLELPREGIGCWHPVIPARTDDVWMLASVAVKYIENFQLSFNEKPNLIILEQMESNGAFSGIRLCETRESPC
jgi:molybdopterin/thiamine biosynthesis adenylyltransferase